MSDQLNIAELPELPMPTFINDGSRLGYTEDQMHSYALAAQAPLVERIKELEAALSEATQQRVREGMLNADLMLSQRRRINELEKQNAEWLDAVADLIKMKGRFQSGMAYQRLVAMYDAALASSQGEQKGVV